ncbi:MAG: hypothetical protein P1Q69_13235 [Candidatus Thorarchaeota archaeon]|nr:hypothetical protein [Candidatus Thorarchaeota archaeon]
MGIEKNCDNHFRFFMELMELLNKSLFLSSLTDSGISELLGNLQTTYREFSKGTTSPYISTCETIKHMKLWYSEIRKVLTFQFVGHRLSEESAQHIDSLRSAVKTTRKWKNPTRERIMFLEEKIALNNSLSYDLDEYIFGPMKDRGSGKPRKEIQPTYFEIKSTGSKNPSEIKPITSFEVETQEEASLLVKGFLAQIRNSLETINSLSLTSDDYWSLKREQSVNLFRAKLIAETFGLSDLQDEVMTVLEELRPN